MRYLHKQLLIAVGLVLLFFPLLFLIELTIRKFWIAFAEEALIRFIPLEISKKEEEKNQTFLNSWISSWNN